MWAGGRGHRSPIEISGYPSRDIPMRYSLFFGPLLSLLYKMNPKTFQALKEIKKAEDPEDGRLCCELYKKLPPRREFKDYYEVIEDPIDLQVSSFSARVCASLLRACRVPSYVPE